MATGTLTKEQREKLWEQFIQERGRAQDDFDSSVRTLAAAGVAITLSLATALKTLPHTGLWAVGLFLGSLGFNLISYVSAQLDMNARTNALKTGADYSGAEKSRWTTATWVLNVLAGAALLAGGGLLVAFIASST